MQDKPRIKYERNIGLFFHKTPNYQIRDQNTVFADERKTNLKSKLADIKTKV